ncbi:MAG: phenylalanine--tRNA ligase subunit beta [Deltaproteobacteria bacterium]|nr:phenylalanine--tRNA ligase subunit beta [Deltaproteobacteria bacterium]
MRVSLKWLKEFVEIDASPSDLAELLTLAGLEVESLEPVGHSLHDVLTARISAIRPHPRADRLYVCEVDRGDGVVPVICSAPNLEVGAMVPLAPPGTRLPGGIKVKESVIRGEKSVGMLLAEDEMGLTDDHSGIMILSPELRPGTPLPLASDIEDWAIDISITPNRSDCTSVIGIAREIVALTGKTLKKPAIELEEEDTPAEDLADVTLIDPEGCPRYSAGIIQDVHLGPSPFWIRYRLFVSGIRSINNIVDVTNYVLLEMGQPLHAFDYDRLREKRIVVRRAEEGEVFTTLDGQTRGLNREVLMICDGERSVALAGIMGGLNSEIFEGSRNVLVESAFFDPVTIRRGSKMLGLFTEASYRFERGIDIEGTVTALKRALMLMKGLAGGRIAKGVIDRYPKPYVAPVIDLRVDRTNAFLGTSIEQRTMSRYLRSLEMTVEELDSNTIRVSPPSFRVDITREVDLVEEISRIEGFESIPVTAPPIKAAEEEEDSQDLVSARVKDIMVGLGFTEIISYSFISSDSADLMEAEEDSPVRSFVKLMNPLSLEQSVMRTSLIPGLLDAVKLNVSYGEENLKLFELGRIFLAREEDELPVERPFLASVMTGLYNRQEWYAPPRKADFYDMKGSIEALLRAVGLIDRVSFERGNTPPHYDGEVSASIHCSGIHIGNLGRISGRILEKIDLKESNVFLFELDMQVLAGEIEPVRRFQPVPKYPAVYRDISLIVRRRLESAEVVKVIKGEGSGLVESAHIFDIYEGRGLDPSEKALNFRICYRSKDHTLDGKEVNRLHDHIIERIMSKTGARLREG